jgi:hypothetical protein
MARQYGEKHHILHHRALHEANKDNGWLRTKGLGMVALLDPDVHDELHRACPGVPPLDIFTAQRVRKHFEGDKNPNLAIEDYMRAVETAKQSPKNHPIERALADLVIMAVDLQRPFIREGWLGAEL